MDFSQITERYLGSGGLERIISDAGYIGLFIIVFAETGLLIGFFLPGDSLLVTAGLLIRTGAVDMSIVLLDLLLIVAAVTGDAIGYTIGRRAGKTLYNRPNSKLFKREHLLKTHDFYEKYGGKTIILARFIPVVRTFAPVVAGAAEMSYRKFALFNIAGGVLWILSMTLAGYGLGSIAGISDYIHIVILAIIVLSIIPPAIEFLKSRRAKASADSA